MKRPSSRKEKFANTALWVALLFFGGILTYLLVRAAIHHSPMTHGYIILVVTAGAAFSLFALTRPTETKVNMALALTIWVTSIYACELFLFFRYPLSQHTVLDIGRPRIPFWGPRDALKTLDDLKASGIDAYPHASPARFIASDGLPGRNLFPLSGISEKVTLLCKELGEPITYKSDEHGFNNPEGLWEKERVEVVLIGDSFTHGNCVQREDGIAGQLRGMGKTVANLGMAGTGPLIQIATLEEYARPITPGIVFWIYCEGNDILNLEQEKKSPTLIRYMRSGFSQNLIKHQSEIDQALRDYMGHEIKKEVDKIQEGVQTASGFEQVAKLAIMRRLTENVLLFRAANLSLFQEVLLQAKRKTAAWGGRFYFVYLPTIERYTLKVDHDAFQSRKKILSVVRDAGIPVIDITDIFATHQDAPSLFAYRTGGHYNADGYRLVAQTIFDTVYRTGVRTLVSDDPSVPATETIMRSKMSDQKRSD